MVLHKNAIIIGLVKDCGISTSNTAEIPVLHWVITVSINESEEKKYNFIAYETKTIFFCKNHQHINGLVEDYGNSSAYAPAQLPQSCTKLLNIIYEHTVKSLI